MKNSKRMFCAVLAVLILLSLAACGRGRKEETISEDDVAALAQGRLDAMYKGEVSETYLKLLGLSEDDVRQAYEENLRINAEFFAIYFDIDYLTDDGKAELVEFFRELFAQASYKVGAVSQMDDDNYVVTVEVAPIDLIQQISEAKDEWLAPFYAKYNGVDFDAMSETEYKAADAEWAGYILDLAKDKLTSLSYLEAENMGVQVSRTEDGGWSVVDDSIHRIDEFILIFP